LVKSIPKEKQLTRADQKRGFTKGRTFWGPEDTKEKTKQKTKEKKKKKSGRARNSHGRTSCRNNALCLPPGGLFGEEILRIRGLYRRPRRLDDCQMKRSSNVRDRIQEKLGKKPSGGKEN